MGSIVKLNESDDRELLIRKANSNFKNLDGNSNSISNASMAIIEEGFVKKTGDTMSGALTVRNASITAGTRGDTTAERAIHAVSGAGDIYLYSQASATGSRGIYANNATGTSGGIIGVNQSNEISSLATVNATMTLKAGSPSVSKAGESVSWYQGRDTAIVKRTSYSGYSAVASMKTTNGSWELGTYTNNVMYFTYITDANHDSKTNTTTTQSMLYTDTRWYGGKVLYSNASGTSGTVTLNESAADFTMLEIYYTKGNDGAGFDCTKVYSPNGKNARLVTAYWTGGSTQLNYKLVKISGMSITVDSTQSRYLNFYEPMQGGTENSQLIFYVVGYK